LFVFFDFFFRFWRGKKEGNFVVFTLTCLYIYLKRRIRFCQMAFLIILSICHLFGVHALTGGFKAGIINVYLLWSVAFFV